MRMKSTKSLWVNSNLFVKNIYKHIWTLSIYFIEQLTLVYSCTIDWIDKDLILSFIMYYFISLYLLYIHPSPPPILGFFQASIHAQWNGTLHMLPSFNEKILKLWLLSNIKSFEKVLFEYFMQTEELFIIANIIQNVLYSTQHEDNNTNLLKMTSNV